LGEIDGDLQKERNAPSDFSNPLPAGV